MSTSLGDREDNKERQLARELGVRRNQLYKWKNEVDDHGETAFSGNGGRPKKSPSDATASLQAELKKRLMRLDRLIPKTIKKFRVTTDSRNSRDPAMNLLNREFKSCGPNEKWVADVTYIPTREGWLFLAAVLDLFSRKIVGWSMGERLTSELAQSALSHKQFKHACLRQGYWCILTEGRNTMQEIIRPC